MLATQVDWNQFLLLAVPAYIAALGTALASVIGALNRRSLQTPSGDPIGHVVERTHDMAAVGVAAVTGTNGPEIEKAVTKLNADPLAPVQLNPDTLEKPQ